MPHLGKAESSYTLDPFGGSKSWSCVVVAGGEVSASGDGRWLLVLPPVLSDVSGPNRGGFQRMVATGRQEACAKARLESSGPV